MDISAAYYEMARITSSASSVTQGMNALLDYTSRVQPGKAWDELRRLDYEEDVLALQGWLEGVFADEPPPSNVKAYWFGIFHPVVDDEASCAFYVTGATEDYTPDTLDWACWTDKTYLPRRRYAPSHILGVLYHAVQCIEDAELLGEYTLCLGYVCLVVSQIARSLDSLLFLGDAEERPVAVGFDSGDNLLLGTVRKTGWLPADPPDSQPMP